MTARYDVMVGWRPESSLAAPGVVTVVDNMWPTERGYEAMPSLIANVGGYLATTTGRVYSAGDVEFAGSVGYTPAVVAVFNGAIYKPISMAWENASISGTALTTAGGIANDWVFEAFQDWVVASTAQQGMLLCKSFYSTGTTASAFHTITGAPIAAGMVVASNFVVALGLTSARNEWKCSGIADPESWTLSASTQCTDGALVDPPGEITGGVSFRGDIIAFKQRGCLLGRYVGPPAVWSWSILHTSAGCDRVRNAVVADDAVWWVGSSGFWKYDGVSVQQISAPIRWLNSSEANLHNLWHTFVIASHDQQRKLVLWHIPSQDATIDPQTGYAYPNRVLSYHPESGRWGWGRTRGITATMKQYLAPSTAGRKTYGANTFDIMSRVYFEAMSTSTADVTGAAAFAGFATASSVSMNWVGDDQRMTLLSRVRPRCRTQPTATATVDHYVTDVYGTTMTAAACAVAMTDGKFDLAKSARWHQVKINVPDGYWEMEGMWYDMETVGSR